MGIHVTNSCGRFAKYNIALAKAIVYLTNTRRVVPLWLREPWRAVGLYAMLYVFLPLVVTAGSVRIWITYLRADLLRIARHEYWSDRFYSAATVLVENPETPEPIISLIESMNKLLSKWIVPTVLYSTYLKDLTSDQQRVVPPPDETFDAFLEKNVDNRRKVQEVAHAGLLAMTYASLINGIQARSVLADVFGLGLPFVEWRGIRETERRAERSAGSLVPIISSRLS
jgi:hypothetical protein